MIDLSRAVAADAAAGAISFDIVDAVSGRAAWLAFEAQAIVTPYQRLDWIEGLIRAYGWDVSEIIVLIIRRGAETVALLPLRKTQRFGCRIAEIPGSKIGNSDWMPMRADAAGVLDEATLSAAFACLRQREGIDLLRFLHLPPVWAGLPNPLLVFPHQEAPDHLYSGTIDASTIANLSKRRRTDIVRGRRRLEESLGPVTLKRARTIAERDAMHDAFIAQRNARFRQMGVSNVFAEPHFMRFFSDTSAIGLEQTAPALCFHALYVGDEIVATAIGAQAGGHYSQYINSNTDGPAAKYSLIGLLMFLLVDELTADGVTSIDMGIGDFAYKENWTAKGPVFDIVLPLSGKGRLAAHGLRAGRSAKRRIKQSRLLWTLTKKARLLRQNLFQ